MHQAGNPNIARTMKDKGKQQSHDECRAHQSNRRAHCVRPHICQMVEMQRTKRKCEIGKQYARNAAPPARQLGLQQSAIDETS